MSRNVFNRQPRQAEGGYTGASGGGSFMMIDVHRPKLEAAIRRHMATGEFRDMDELLDKAIAALPLPAATPDCTGGQALIDAFKPIRGLLTDEEVDALFARDQSPDRTIELS